MDSKGNIYNAQQVADLKQDTEDLTAVRTVKELVELDKETAQSLARLPRALRRAWYSDYRKELKRARKAGREARTVPVPELPAK